jgi:hypothetical protein
MVSYIPRNTDRYRPKNTNLAASTPRGTFCRTAAYAAISSSTIQPSDQPTNLALYATDFSVTVVKIFNTNFPLTKKGCKNDPVYYWGAQLPPKYPGYLEGVLELLCGDIRCPSWKYDNGRLGDCRNSFFVFVSDRSRSGLAENLGQIHFS